jgi:hypothetical protein
VCHTSDCPVARCRGHSFALSCSKPSGQLPARHAVAPRVSPPSAAADCFQCAPQRLSGRPSRAIALQMVAPPHLTPAEREVPMHAARHAAALCMRRTTQRLASAHCRCDATRGRPARPGGASLACMPSRRRRCGRIHTAAVGGAGRGSGAWSGGARVRRPLHAWGMPRSPHAAQAAVSRL